MRTKNIPNREKAPSPTDGLDGIRAIATGVAYNDNDITPLSLRQEGKRRAKRRQYRFWLEEDKPIQCELAWWFEELKLSRKFAPIIRDALSLYREFMKGETAMLYELFPKLNPPPPIPAKKIEDMQKKIDELQDRVNSLTDIVIKQNAPGAVDMTVKMVSAGEGAPVRTPRVLSAPPPVIAAVAVEVDTSSAFLDAF